MSAKRPRLHIFATLRQVHRGACELSVAHLPRDQYAAHVLRADEIAAELRRLDRLSFAAFQAKEQSHALV